ncbi:hypothetical protein ABPG77_010377 [Micractinium sp. CCAP 211/92]
MEAWGSRIPPSELSHIVESSTFLHSPHLSRATCRRRSSLPLPEIRSKPAGPEPSLSTPRPRRPASGSSSSTCSHVSTSPPPTPGGSCSRAFMSPLSRSQDLDVLPQFCSTGGSSDCDSSPGSDRHQAVAAPLPLQQAQGPAAAPWKQPPVQSDCRISGRSCLGGASLALLHLLCTAWLSLCAVGMVFSLAAGF